jgi:hypothetical protein
MYFEDFASNPCIFKVIASQSELSPLKSGSRLKILCRLNPTRESRKAPETKAVTDNRRTGVFESGMASHLAEKLGLRIRGRLQPCRKCRQISKELLALPGEGCGGKSSILRILQLTPVF